MILHKTTSWTLIVSLSLLPSAPALAAEASETESPLFVYPSNHGFLHQTGHHVPYGWAAMYRIHAPGYFIEAQSNGGEFLEPGIYRYVFPFSILPGQLGGLLKNADDVVRIEAWDATTHECLVSRTLQVADFLPVGRKATIKSVTFSTLNRKGHRFEPRVYWQGLSGVFLGRMELHRLGDISLPDLNQKALRLEKAMVERYNDRGYVVSRNLHGEVEDIGDAAIWTGLYAASQAWRYRATRDPEALARMEDSLRALHRLADLSPTPGTLVRYLDSSFQPLLDPPASKDTYTGYFFAAAQCLPVVKDRGLRRDILSDIDRIAGHFLDHDLAFVPNGGQRLEFNPSLSNDQMAEIIQALERDAGDRQHLIRMLEAVNLYFLIHGQRPWPELPKMIRDLKARDFASVRRNLVAFLNGALEALRQLQRNVHRSAVLWSWRDAPYQKLDHLLLRILEQLAVPPGGSFQGIQDLKILSSQSMHALHFVKVAASVLPRPNRYERFYRENLWENKALLKTVQQWDNVDEELIAAVAGDAQAAALRTSSAHLSFLALFDLAHLEKNRDLRTAYLSLYDREFRPHQADYNAMLHVMQGVLGLGPDQTGMAAWSLALYPEDRRGKGEAYWQARRKQLAARYGGVASGKARDPLPLNERQRDSFIWQRSARSLRGDHRDQFYPPLDFLFVYWLARANGQLTPE